MANSLTHAAVVGTNNPSSNISDEDLLRQVGIRGMQRRAGFMPPESHIKLPPIAEVSDEKICSQATVAQFFKLYDSSRIHLRSIWLERFIETGQKFPNEFLPDLLKRLDKNFRAYSNNRRFLPLISHQRMEWLIQFPEYENLEWVLNKSSKVDDNHKVSMKDDFVTRFKTIRVENPYKAVDWLSDNWHQFRAEWGLALLEVLHLSLNPHDELFLQELLTDCEHVEVVDKAAYLLSLLEADCVQKILGEIIKMTAMEMTQDGAVLDFRWTRVFEEHHKFAPKEDLLDPIASCYSWSGTELQLIQTVPLEYWCQHYKATPQALVAAIYNGFHGKEFSEAWWHRLQHETREDFLRALLNNRVTGFWFKPWDYSKSLIEHLPFALFQIVVDEWLNNA